MAGVDVSAYEKILGLTQQMLEAAKKSEWDELILIEKNRAGLVKDLMSHPQDGGALDAQTHEIIRRILASDTEIKTLTESWLAELREAMACTVTEKKLLQAYRSPT